MPLIKIDKDSDTIIHFPSGIRLRFEPKPGGFTLWVLNYKEDRQDSVDIDLSWATEQGSIAEVGQEVSGAMTKFIPVSDEIKIKFYSGDTVFQLEFHSLGDEAEKVYITYWDEKEGTWDCDRRKDLTLVGNELAIMRKLAGLVVVASNDMIEKLFN